MAERPATIGSRLRELRAGRGLTQMELASAAGLNVSLVTQIEQGRTPDPRISTLEALADALECSLDELVGRRTPAPPAEEG